MGSIKIHSKYRLFVLFSIVYLVTGMIFAENIPIETDYENPQINSTIKPSTTTLNIVTSITIIQDIVTKILGQDVVVIVSGAEDPHSYEPTSSEVSALENADIIFRLGIADLEPWWRSGWEDSLVVKLVDPLMLKIDPLLGFANPHVWMDPNNIINFTNKINNTLWDNEPLQSNKWIFSNNTETYINTLDLLLVEINNAKSTFQGMKLVVNHPSFFYLFQESLLNISRVATIEKGEGQEPSAKDMANVITLMKQQNCHLIVTNPQRETENIYEIARETNSKIAILTPLLNVDVKWNGNDVTIENYTQMIEFDIWALAHPLDPPPILDLWLIILIIGISVAIIFIIGIILRRRR